MIKKLIEQRNRLLSEARALMQGENITAETRAKVDSMLTDANALKADIERLQSASEENEIALPEHRNAPPRGEIESTSTDARSFEERRAATNVALRAFLRGEKFEQRDLTVSSNGGVMIPVAALEPVQAQRSAGSIYDVVRKLRTNTGEDVKVPLWDDTSNGFVLESASVTTTDPAIDGITVKVDGLRSNPILLDNKLVQDLAYDLVGDVNAAIQQRYRRSISQFITSGNTSNFTGMLGNVPAAFTTAGTAAIGYDDLVGLVTALDPEYGLNAIFSMSNTTLGSILKIKDANQRPLFVPFNDGATSGFAGTILGYPVKLNQFGQAVATGNTPVIFGDHAAGYCVREVMPGVVIKRSSERWIELNRLGVVAFARAGGAPTIASTTYSPLVTMTVK